MATPSHIVTGKKIYELEELIGIMKNEAWFAMSQDNLTRKVSARSFRTFINGDNDEPSDESYYSSSKIEALFNNAGDRFVDIETDIDNINQRIDDLTNTVQENYETLDNRITKEVNTLNDRIDKEVDTLNKRITAVYNELVAADDALRNRCTALENRCTQLESRCTALEQRCSNIEKSIQDLDNKLENWILYGSAAPTTSTLPAGRLYIQWF